MKNIKTYNQLFENIYDEDDPQQDAIKKEFYKLTVRNFIY